MMVIILRNNKNSQVILRVCSGAPGGIRTPGLEVRSLALYPAKLQVQIFNVPIYYSLVLSIIQEIFAKI